MKQEESGLTENNAKAHIFSMCLMANLTHLRLESKHKVMRKIEIDNINTYRLIVYIIDELNVNNRSIYYRYMFSMNQKDVNNIIKHKFYLSRKFLIENNIICRFQQSEFYFLNPFYRNFMKDINEVRLFNLEMNNYIISLNDERNYKAMIEIYNNNQNFK